MHINDYNPLILTQIALLSSCYCFEIKLLLIAFTISLTKLSHDIFLKADEDRELGQKKNQ